MKKYVVYFSMDGDEWCVDSRWATEEEAQAQCDKLEIICNCYYEEEYL